MSYIALALGLLLVLVIALLCVPLAVAFSIHRTDKIQGVVSFRWLFGLVRIQLRIPTAGRTGARPPAQPKEKSKPSRRRNPKAAVGNIFSLIRDPAFRRRVRKFIRDILRATHARDLLFRLRIGLGDPADTGQLWAIMGPIAGLAQNLRGVVVRIEPEFVDPVFEIESRGNFRLVPIQFIGLTVAFLLSPTMLRAWRLLRRGNA